MLSMNIKQGSFAKGDIKFFASLFFLTQKIPFFRLRYRETGPRPIFELDKRPIDPTQQTNRSENAFNKPKF